VDQDRVSQGGEDQGGTAQDRSGQDGATQNGPDQGQLPAAAGAAEIIAHFGKMSEGTLSERMGIVVTSASAQQVTATMPVHGNTQPYGLLHGGASCVLAETIGSLGAALHSGPGSYVVGIEIGATHHQAARDGLVTAVATRLHGGRSVVSYEIVISDEHGRRICTARLTCLIRDRVPAGHRAGT
jgi:uncharacterized protein (TIGR00369 family)